MEEKKIGGVRWREWRGRKKDGGKSKGERVDEEIGRTMKRGMKRRGGGKKREEERSRKEGKKIKREKSRRK